MTEDDELPRRLNVLEGENEDLREKFLLALKALAATCRLNEALVRALYGAMDDDEEE